MGAVDVTFIDLVDIETLSILCVRRKVVDGGEVSGLTWKINVAELKYN